MGERRKAGPVDIPAGEEWLRNRAQMHPSSTLGALGKPQTKHLDDFAIDA